MNRSLVALLGLSAAAFALSASAVLGASFAASLLMAEGSPSIRSGRIAWDESRPLAAGRIVAVDGPGMRVAVEHGPIRPLYLPPGTAMFRIEDPEALAGLSRGDKIRFAVEREGRSYFITRLENTN